MCCYVSCHVSLCQHITTQYYRSRWYLRVLLVCDIAISQFFTTTLNLNRDSLLGTSHGDSCSVDSYSRLDIREGCLGAANCLPGEAQVDDACDVLRMLSVHESLSSMIKGCRPVPRLVTSLSYPASAGLHSGPLIKAEEGDEFWIRLPDMAEPNQNRLPANIWLQRVSRRNNPELARNSPSAHHM